MKLARQMLAAGQLGAPAPAGEQLIDAPDPGLMPDAEPAAGEPVLQEPVLQEPVLPDADVDVLEAVQLATAYAAQAVEAATAQVSALAAERDALTVQVEAVEAGRAYVEGTLTPAQLLAILPDAEPEGDGLVAWERWRSANRGSFRVRGVRLTDHVIAAPPASGNPLFDQSDLHKSLWR